MIFIKYAFNNAKEANLSHKNAAVPSFPPAEVTQRRAGFAFREDSAARGKTDGGLFAGAGQLQRGASYIE